MRVVQHGDWLSAKTGEGLVMMSAEQGDYLGLSKVGARIWQLIETPRHVDEICAILLAEFDVTPETCRTDVEEFLGELVKHGAAALQPTLAA
jgi:hypothetical protein